MPNKPATQQQLLAENADLRVRLAQARASLHEMRSGEVDALVVSDVGGVQLFAPADADQSFRILVGEMSEGALTMTAEGVIVYANRHMAGMLKTPLEKLMGSTIRTWIAPDSQPTLQSLLSKGAGEERHGEVVLAASDATGIPVHLSVSNLPLEGSPDAYCLVAFDLTEHNRAEAIAASERVARELLAAANQSRGELLRVIEDKTRAEVALAQESERSRMLLRSANDAIILADGDGNIVEWSAAAERLFGYTHAEACGQPLTLVIPERYRGDHSIGMQRVRTGGARHIIGRPTEFQALRRTGAEFPVELSLSTWESESGTMFAGIIRDITERKQAEQALRTSEERFKTIFLQAPFGVALIDSLAGHIYEVNPRFAEIAGRSMTEMADIDWLRITHPDDVQADLENMALLNVGKINGFQMEKRYLHPDGTVVWVNMTIAPLKVEDKAHPRHLCMIQDITEKRRAEEDVQRYAEQLQIAFMSTVQVATTMSEMRDPYTAGHARRVAEIAVAIGAELGLDARRQQGLRVAGNLHDVGKITIPSEILSKPGKISAVEYQLLQGHAQAGYDVLKAVEFPWPVAQVALQHHERLDGSGYPQGLKGEQILLEARILAVADVVEAMSSHRPYRPGLGIDEALAEIERGRGTAYDALVADACLKLFREKGFAIPA